MDMTPVVLAVQTAADKAPSFWEKASAIGTVGATVVALLLGLYQWFKDIRRQKDVRAALSRSLRADLESWREVVDDHRQRFDRNELRSELQYVAWVNALKTPTMPALERFYMMLPDLGRPVSRKVVHAYAEAMRVGELITWETGKRGVMDRDYINIAKDIRGNLDVLRSNLSIAAEALKPYE